MGEQRNVIEPATARPVRAAFSGGVLAALLLTGMPAAAAAATNSPPVTVPDSGAMYSRSKLIVDVLANDHDPDGDRLRLVGARATSAGARSVRLDGGHVVVRSSAGYVGPLTVRYVAADEHGAQAIGQLRISVVASARNRAPLARRDTARVRAGRTYRIAVLANDKDPDGDRIRLAKVGRAKHGTSTKVGSRVQYRAKESFSGTETIRYWVKDAHGARTRGTLKVRVKKARTTKPVVPTRVQVERALDRLGMPGGTVDGVYTAATRRALCAWRTIAAKPASRALPTAAEARAIVAMKRLPGARPAMVAGVNVSRTCQAAFWVSDGGAYRRVMAATTGMKDYRTRVGTFRIFRTYRTWRWSMLYPEARMYKPMQFSGGQALHGSATDALVKTYPASHGCVRMLHRDIDALQAGGVGNGTLVRVFGKH